MATSRATEIQTRPRMSAVQATLERAISEMMAARRKRPSEGVVPRCAIRASNRAWTTRIPAVACMARRSHNHQHHGAIVPVTDSEVARELEVSAAALAIWNNVERCQFFT